MKVMKHKMRVTGKTAGQTVGKTASKKMGVMKVAKPKMAVMKVAKPKFRVMKVKKPKFRVMKVKKEAVLDPDTITEKEWNALAPDEQAKVLSKMANPTGAEYRRFHTAMGKAGEELNEQFKQRYKELSDLKAKKGSSVGKQLPLRELTKMWLLSSKSTKDGDQVAVWKSGFMNREAWASKEDVPRPFMKPYT